MSIQLIILTLISASIHLWGEYGGPDELIYIFKPLTMLLIIYQAWRLPAPANKPHYKNIILLGLAFSLGGDILLIFPNLFLFGLISFLIAQIIYIVAFRKGRPFTAFTWAQLPLLAYGVIIFLILQPGLGSMAIPVALYMLVIMTMLWQAWDQWQPDQQKWAMLALIGAASFVLSDTLLAFNKFHTEFALARLLTLTTYFCAQWLIAHSILQEE